MAPRRLKTWYFALTALNTIATSYFFNYLFFFLHRTFGYGDRENLWVSALYGFIYIFSAWQCGKFAERRGFLTSLKIGFGSMALLMIAGAFLQSAAGMVLVVAGYGVALLFTWPALEALVSENESRAGVQHMVGIYNCTWAAAAALAYFTGGKLFDWLGRGAVFGIPAVLFAAEFFIVIWLSKYAVKPAIPTNAPPEPAHPEPAAFAQRVNPHGFLKMAWLANPFAFVAINTLWPVMPGLAARLALSPTQVGLFCSVWLFGRFAAFALLWQWTGWHYRFRWLLTAFLMLVASFMAILLAHQLWIVVSAQIFFGLATGLIYYSSLFYSMDVGETKGEHGGFHEAAIGAGTCAGPLVGAASLQFLPHVSNANVLAVGALLVTGLAGLLGIWTTSRRARVS